MIGLKLLTILLAQFPTQSEIPERSETEIELLTAEKTLAQTSVEFEQPEKEVAFYEEERIETAEVADIFHPVALDSIPLSPVTTVEAFDDDQVEFSPSLENASIDEYENLRITPRSRKQIGQLLTTMAENNVFKLLLEKRRLERIGEELEIVHPVRFLGTVFTDPRLIYCMREIRTSSFKWDNFVDGFARRMKEESARNNLVKYVPGFAQAIKRDPKALYPYFQKADFEGLVNYLLDE